jgi:DNA polymerase III subunit tau-like protein
MGSDGERRPLARPTDSTSDAGSSGEQPSDPSDPIAPTGPAGRDALDLEQVKRVWPSVLDQLLQTAPALAATFEGARPTAFDTGEVTIGFPVDHIFNKRKAEAPDKREQMAAALETVLGEKLRPAYAVFDGDEAAPGVEGEDGGVDHAALVEKIKSEFDAEEVG